MGVPPYLIGSSQFQGSAKRRIGCAPHMTFDQLGLSPDVLRAVADAGYAEPTPIQEQAIPLVLGGRDLIGIAQTGTGKTAGFTLPMIDILAKGRARARMPRSLILEPTRELAAQVASNFETYGKYVKLSMALVIGGVAFTEQGQKLSRGVDVLIATPGRLLDHFERGKVLLADIRVLVIDEADRMLDMGFIPDVERIIRLLPRTRQTLMFSATMPPEVRRLTNTYMRDPQQTEAAPPATTADRVIQQIAMVAGDPKSKRQKLRTLLRQENVKNGLIFCNRKRDVAVVDRSLRLHEFNAAALHGDMPQVVRMETLERFKKDEIRFLVASDVAARGLDIVEMSHVFNYDVPINADDYIHRIGRTARAGREGHAITLVTPAEKRQLAAIEKLIGHPLDRLKGGVEEVVPDVPKRSRADRGGTTGRRGARRREEEAGTDRRRGRDRKPAIEDDAVVEEAVPDVPKNSRSDRGGTTGLRGARRHEDEAGIDRRRGRARRPTAEDDTDDAVVGMGDHVPPFLLR